MYRYRTSYLKLKSRVEGFILVNLVFFGEALSKQHTSGSILQKSPTQQVSVRTQNWLADHSSKYIKGYSSSKQSTATRSIAWWISICALFRCQSRTLNRGGKFAQQHVAQLDQVILLDSVEDFLTVPDEKSFYMILTTSTLNVLTSRRNQITKT